MKIGEKFRTACHSRVKYVFDFLKYEKVFSYSIFGTSYLLLTKIYPSTILLFIIFLIFLLGFLLLLKNWKGIFLILFFSSILFTVTILGQSYDNSLSNLQKLCQQKCTVTAKLREYSICTTQYCNVKISDILVENSKFSGNFDLVVYSTKLVNLQSWDQIKFSSKFQLFENSDLNYYHTVGYSGEFLFPSKIEKIQNIDSEYSYSMLRENLSKYISFSSQKFLGPNGDLVEGIVFGAKDYYTSNKETIQKLGLSHVFVVSGFNLTILVIFLYSFNSLLKRKWILILGLLASFIYMFLIGFDNVPSLRAYIFIAIIFLSKFYNFRISSISLLALSIFLLHIVIPYSLFQISFQLTFLALVGIFYSSKFLTTFLDRIFPKFVANALGVSLGAQIFVTPVIIFNFGVLAPFTLLSTLFVMSLVEIITIFGLVFYVLCSIPLLNSVIANSLNLWVEIFNLILVFLNQYFFLINISKNSWWLFSIIPIICLIVTFEINFQKSELV